MADQNVLAGLVTIHSSLSYLIALEEDSEEELT
jgi:hypothetical protein